MNKGYKPSRRVHFAMQRITRNKYILGHDAAAIAFKLARCASPASPHAVLKNAIPSECEYVGMINGRPPFFHFEPGYREFIRWLRVTKKGRKIDGAAAEIKMLQILDKLNERG